MLDLETLGTRPGATIVSIGCLSFVPGEPLENHFYRRVEVVGQGREIDAATVVWWASQPEFVQRELTEISGRHPLKTALAQLAEWFKRVQPEQVWAQDPDFDLVILRDAYEQQGMELPWKFWAGRSVRTRLDDLPRELRLSAAHHALHDCAVQARNVSAALMIQDFNKTGESPPTTPGNRHFRGADHAE